MAISRRHFLALTAAQAAAQSTPPAKAPAPQICLYSQPFIEVEYADLAPILKGFGVNACDLSMIPGGHVPPGSASRDLIRAVESLRGAGVDVPVITTAITAMQEANAQEAFAICQIVKVPICKVGVWSYGEGPVEARLAEVRRAWSGLAALGAATEVTVALPNQAGENVGAAIWDADPLLRGLDAKRIGYAFDIAQAVAAAGNAWPQALRVALPRTQCVTASDFRWEKAAAQWRPAPCPLGEGMVDWPRFCKLLAAGGFRGPITLRLNYGPENQIRAVERDLAFLRQQLAQAYAA